MRVMDNSALVYIPIVKDGKNLGTVGVLGPARMDYARVLATPAGNIGQHIQPAGRRKNSFRAPPGICRTVTKNRHSSGVDTAGRRRK